MRGTVNRKHAKNIGGEFVPFFSFKERMMRPLMAQSRELMLASTYQNDCEDRNGDVQPEGQGPSFPLVVKHEGARNHCSKININHRNVIKIGPIVSLPENLQLLFQVGIVQNFFANNSVRHKSYTVKTNRS